MKRIKKTTAGWLVAPVLLFVFGACAPKTMIDIDYKMPDKSTALQGVSVALEFQDVRENKNLLRADAGFELKELTDKFSYSVVEGEKTQFVGIFDAATLFQQTMTQRLESMGAVVLPAPDAGDPVIRILLKSFTLSFKDRTWIAEMEYDTHLLIDGNIRARENVSGSSQRAKIIGSNEADRVMTDLYTDMINKLNVKNLLHQGGVL